MPISLRPGARLASCPTRPYPLLLSFLLFGLLLLSACNAAPQPKSAASPTPQTPVAPSPTYDFPAVNANYVYDQLYYLSTTFQQRESGFDLDPEHNGHQAFARYWVQEMQQDLQGFQPQVTYDMFTGGWISRPGDSPSYNVEVTIPGALHPEQVVVVGSHFDGMHVSQGSAFDDTSGCALMLGEAKALADYWRSHHLYPARTLRFVLFDAEEQGVLGSYHYINRTVSGDIANIVAMFNEEQSGLSYPVRFLGKTSNPVIPLTIWNIGTTGKPILGSLINSALPTVADEMRTLGYTSVTYHDDQGHDVSRPVFTADQIPQMTLETQSIPASDNVGFEQASVPTLTFIAGDEDGYDPKTGRFKTSNIPANESYPFDTHLDTIQLMNGYANGETQKSQALVLALEFQTMLQAWMFNQPDLVGAVTIDQIPAGPLAAISDIGPLQPGVALTLTAQSAFDPHAPQRQFSYAWDFGDGTQAQGAQTQHTYAHAGTYTLTLTVQDAAGTRQVSKRLTVSQHPPTYDNVLLPLLQTERDSGSELAQGDNHPSPSFQLPPIIQNGDGLTDVDHFPGHNG